MRRKKPASPAQIARHIRAVLKHDGYAPYSQSAQRFFKETIQAHGWRTHELRKVGATFRRTLLRERGPEFLLAVADQLFRGPVIDDKNMAIFLLEKDAAGLGDAEFRLLDSWLDRVTNWAEHDALAHNLIGPLVAADEKRAPRLLAWARSKNRWRRRAACVALIRAARQRRLFPEIVRVSNRLLSDPDDMVQKGLGWLLRETAKADPQKTVPYLLKLRARAPRLVLRTACETLPAATRARVLADPPSVVK